MVNLTLSDVSKSQLESLFDKHLNPEKEDPNFYFIAQVEVDRKTKDICGIYPMARTGSDGSSAYVVAKYYDGEKYRIYKGECELVQKPEPPKVEKKKTLLDKILDLLP